ncbi:MAG: hypothetical protein EZS28_016268 [Streblomastix strix]|uniref:Uncharacterized protein n=1 Tax=Streblomastix strix TaxID=222440 RepID=A0A5J4W189_9EUKA|nr:MAG: hypothetical protein EZS28_016268 [Streblomastix strix]
MASCANAVKYSMAHIEFKLDGNYSIVTFDPPFYLTPQCWKAKVEGYWSQDKLAKPSIDNNVKEVITIIFKNYLDSPVIFVKINLLLKICPHQTEQTIPYLIPQKMLDNAAYIVTRSKVTVTSKR